MASPRAPQGTGGRTGKALNPESVLPATRKDLPFGVWILMTASVASPEPCTTS
jgi:hypothetical protein